MSDYDDESSEDFDDPSESDFSPSDSDDSRAKTKAKKAKTAVKKSPANRASSSNSAAAKKTKKKPPAKKKKTPTKKKTTPAKKKKAAAGKGRGGGGGKKKPAAKPRTSKSAKKSSKKDSDDEEDEAEEDGDMSEDEEELDADGDASDDGGDEDEEKKPKGGGKRKAKPQAKGKKVSKQGSVEVDQILQQVKKLMLDTQREKAVVPTLAELGIKNVREVSDSAPYKVLFEIEKLVVMITESILKGESFSYTVPTRGAANQLYIPELDRLVLSDKVTERSFLNPREVRKTALTTRALQLVHEVLSKGIHITKRDLFYTDVKLFVDQKDSDHILDDMACMLGCTRSCLNVVASEKGLIVGRVQFEEDGDPIDCTRMGVGGKAIPPFIDKISNIQSDAKFILLVEKEAAYLRIAEDRFYNKYPCIVITGKGQPDVATRVFLKRLKNELNIPVLGLFDSDPYGLKILSVYMSGSKNMSYDSASLTTPDIKWLGVRPSDLDRYKLPEQCRLDMTETDMRTGRQLLKEEFVLKNPEWVKELELMMKTKKKAEIQALSAFGFQYITEDYLPRKLEKGDWI